MAGPLRPNPPPPLELKWPMERWKKIGSNKGIFSLMAPPLLMARPLREELFLRLPLLG